jgi:hypothetical protein
LQEALAEGIVRTSTLCSPSRGCKRRISGAVRLNLVAMAGIRMALGRMVELRPEVGRDKVDERVFERIDRPVRDVRAIEQRC